MTAAAARSSVEAALTSPAPALAGTVIVAPPLALLFWLSGAVSLATALAAMVVVSYVVLSSGVLFLRLAGCEDMPTPAAWALGVFCTAVALNALVFTCQLLAASAFVIWALVVMGLRFAMRPTRPVSRPADRRGLAALALCMGATAYWCWDLAEAPHFLWRDAVLTTWVDQYVHASTISQFGDPRAAGWQHMELAGVAREPYHYASYMLPAALAWPLDLPGLPLATSVWVPLGFLTACAGAYVLGAVLAGTAGGLAALGALTLLPDAASYGLHNRLYGYYWYVLAVPTASYSVGVTLLAIAFLTRWFAVRNARALLTSAAVVAGSVVIRVHNFVVFAPAWFICTALSFGWIRRRALLLVSAALGVFGMFVWAFYHLRPDMPHALAVFLDVAHLAQQPVAYGDLYARLMSFYGSAVAVPVGVLLVLAATLGNFGILYPLSLLAVRRLRPLGLIDLVPLAVLAVYLLLILTAPIPAHGDATEFTQRPFVVVYAVFGVWTAAGLASWLAMQELRRRRVWLPFVITAAFIVLWALYCTVADWRWAKSYKVPDGLPQAATYLRSRSQYGDVLAASGLTTEFVPADLPVELTAMSGIPAYLSRPFMHAANGGLRAQIALERYAALRAVEREKNADAALARLRSLGIRWYVVAESDGGGPRWDPQRRRAVFVDRMVAVYATR